MPDAVRDELRRRWTALINGETSRSLTVSWAQMQLDKGDWLDAVTHAGVQRLHDLWPEAWEVVTDEGRCVLFRRYWDWMELVRQFEDDPVAWNRWYALRFASRLSGAQLQRKVLNDFLRDGFVSDADIAEFQFEQ